LASKKTRSRFIKGWKKRYLWVSEDLLHVRWCHGKVKDWHDSDENLTHCEVANIGNIKVMNNATLALYLIDDPDHDLCFQVGKDKAQRWKDCLTRLCQDQLTYRLLWDERDQGTEISLHWRGDDVWFPGTITGWDIEKLEHQIDFHDGFVALYDLTRVFFRVEKLPGKKKQKNKKTKKQTYYFFGLFYTLFLVYNSLCSIFFHVVFVCDSSTQICFQQKTNLIVLFGSCFIDNRRDTDVYDINDKDTSFRVQHNNKKTSHPHLKAAESFHEANSPSKKVVAADIVLETKEEPISFPPPTLLSITYTPEFGNMHQHQEHEQFNVEHHEEKLHQYGLKAGDSIVIEATCSHAKPMKKDTAMSVHLNNGKTVILNRGK